MTGVLLGDFKMYLIPITIAYWTKGDGTFDKGRGQRIILCTDSFTLNKVNRLISILLEKYNINTYVKSLKSGQIILHSIAISIENRIKYQKLVSCFVLLSLLYSIGL